MSLSLSVLSSPSPTSQERFSLLPISTRMACHKDQKTASKPIFRNYVAVGQTPGPWWPTENEDNTVDHRKANLPGFLSSRRPGCPPLQENPLRLGGGLFPTSTYRRRRPLCSRSLEAQLLEAQQDLEAGGRASATNAREPHFSEARRRRRKKNNAPGIE